MDLDINYQKALQMLNTQLQKMKSGMNEVDQMSLKGDKKKMAKHMHKIYDKIDDMVDTYSKSQKQGDFNSVCRELEALQPAFVLNYNEICYEEGLDLLNSTIDEMEREIHHLEKLQLTGAQGEKAETLLEIYNQICDQVEKYAVSHEHSDFEIALHYIGKLKPKFTLNYNELAS